MSAVSAPHGPAAHDATAATSFACSGCGTVVGAEQLPLRCPGARPGDDVDHVLRRRLDSSLVSWPAAAHANPFIAYRSLLDSYHRARARGWSDRAWVSFVEGLDRAVAEVEGHGFRTTPLVATPDLDRAAGFAPGAGGILIKDETGGVGGSHKARHLFGILLGLEIAGGQGGAPLAIASCGNAALAAAIVARAAGRRLLVFIPTDAEPSVVARLRELGAELTVCPRHPDEPGDPTVARLDAAIAAGAIPFTCQGDRNGLAVEGGETLGYELVDALAARGSRLDRLFIQVGGGALASSVWQALEDAHRLGAIERLPRLHAVQTANTSPLARAYRRVTAHLLDRLGAPDGLRLGSAEGAPDASVAIAERLRAAAPTQAFADALGWVARHRSGFMWPWEHEPHSIAGGILDDETYDWLAVVTGMLVTGGWPVLVDEAALASANRIAVATTGIDVDPTGSAGLAGLLALRHEGSPGAVADDETIGVIFTGIRRGPGGPAVPPAATNGDHP